MVRASMVGLGSSPVVTATYTLQVPAPVFSVASGRYSSPQTVTISASVGSTIYYTTDGSTPSATNGIAIASGASVNIPGSEVVKAMGIAKGWTSSPVSSQSYQIDNTVAQVAAPTFSVGGGTYSSAQTVAISASSGSTIYYTTNGSTPSATNGTAIASGSSISVSVSEVINAVGVAQGLIDSPISSQTYEIDSPSAASNKWTWMSGSGGIASSGTYGTEGLPGASNTPGGRSQASSWADSKGNLWLFGGLGFDSTGSMKGLNDLWEFVPSTGQWAWMNGSSSSALPGCISGVYGSLGVPDGANVPGSRSNAMTWTDANGNLWLFGGMGCDSAGNAGLLNDEWMLNPDAANSVTGTKGVWTWMSGDQTLPGKTNTGHSGVYNIIGVANGYNIPGGRQQAVTWTDASGNLWLFGGRGYDSAGVSGTLNDLWKFNPNTANSLTGINGVWTWMGGSATLPGSNLGTAGVYNTKGQATGSSYPGSRNGAVAWTGNDGNLWLFGGTGYDSKNAYKDLNDLWKFNPTAENTTTGVLGVWTWVSGSNTGSQDSINYGESRQGIPNLYSVPASRTQAVGWKDADGNFWLFGGYFGGVNQYPVIPPGFKNDLWRYNPTTNQWAWMKGSFGVTAAGTYGTKGIPTAGNTPGSRVQASGWTDSEGNLWLFGGQDQGSTQNVYNDLWQYHPYAPIPMPVIKNSAETVTITDSYSAATIYYTLDGTIPTTDSQLYTGPFAVYYTQGNNVRAIAVLGTLSSNVASLQFWF
jgi:N-acetylneuraminic acid mutarotase